MLPGEGGKEGGRERGRAGKTGKEGKRCVSVGAVPAGGAHPPAQHSPQWTA